MYLREWSELELVFVPQGYSFDQPLLLLYVLAVEILQQNVLFVNFFKCSQLIEASILFYFAGESHPFLLIQSP